MYIRGWGRSPEEAEDLTQAFFVSLLGREHFHLADPSKRHFRSFLISSDKFFLANRTQAARRLKRGGDVQLSRLDGPGRVGPAGDRKCPHHPSHRETPGRVFERHWPRRPIEQLGVPPPCRVCPPAPARPLRPDQSIRTGTVRRALFGPRAPYAHLPGRAESRHQPAPQALPRFACAGNFPDDSRAG